MTADEARRRQILARWHRRLAVVIGLWLVLLAITGVFINHAHDWALDRSPLPDALQHMVYGIDARADYCTPYPALGTECRDVFARLALPAGELLLGVSRLLLLDGQGRLVESLPAGQLGLAGLEAVLQRGESIYLRDGRQTVRTDPELMDWEPMDSEAAAALDDDPWQLRPRGETGITWERLLLDLHAARFLGPGAKYVNDLLAALILVLAFSGAWLWRAKRRRD
jgi:hypothetical protein